MFVSVVDGCIKIGLHSWGECTSYNITLTKDEFDGLQSIRAHIFMRAVNVSSELIVNTRWNWVILNKNHKLALTKSEWTALKACIPYVRKFL